MIGLLVFNVITKSMLDYCLLLCYFEHDLATVVVLGPCRIEFGFVYGLPLAHVATLAALQEISVGFPIKE